MAKKQKKAAASRKQAAKKKPAKQAVKLGDPLKTYETLNGLMNELGEQCNEFERGKKVAVSRARKAAGEMRKLLGLFRKEIQAAKADM